jgi:hypothetical protein
MLQNMIFGSLGGLVKKRQEHKKKGELFKIWRNTDTEARKHNAAHTYTMQQGRRCQKKRRTSASKGKGAQLRITLYI